MLPVDTALIHHCHPCSMMTQVMACVRKGFFGLRLRIGSRALDPIEIIWTPVHNGMDDEFRDVIRVFLLDQFVKLWYQGSASLDEEHNLRIILNCSFPPVVALDLGNRVDACSNFAFHNSQGQLFSILLVCRCSDSGNIPCPSG